MSDCNACFYAGDYEAPDFYHKEFRKARKPYFCCECHEPIAIGQEYEYVSGKWDGQMDAFRTCLPCSEIRDTFGCDGYVHMQLWENIREGMFDGFTTGCLEKLVTAAAKTKLVAEWNDWKFN